MKKFIVGFFFVLRLAFNLLFVGIENGDKTILDVKMVDGNRVTFSR
jgi:small basic protein